MKHYSGDQIKNKLKESLESREIHIIYLADTIKLTNLETAGFVMRTILKWISNSELYSWLDSTTSVCTSVPGPYEHYNSGQEIL